jgi:hypothetical protein
MKKEFQSFFLFASFIFLSVYALGQSNRSVPPPAERAKKQTEWMRTHLNLTDAQAAQAESINLNYANKTEQLRINAQDKRQKLKTLKSYAKAKDDELKKVFTAEQYKTYQAKKEELKDELHQEMKNRKSSAG